MHRRAWVRRLRHFISFVVILAQLGLPLGLAQARPTNESRPARDTASSERVLGNLFPFLQTEPPTLTPDGTETPTPDATETPAETETPTLEGTASPQGTETATPVPTETLDASTTPDPVPTPSPSLEPTGAPTATLTPTPTPTPTSLTETPTPEGTASATPTTTGTPSETQTATPTPDATVEATLTPTGTPTETPSQPPDLRFSVSTSVEEVEIGDEAIITVVIENVGTSDALDLRLRNALADGLTFVPAPRSTIVPVAPTPTPEATPTGTPSETQTVTPSPTDAPTATPEVSSTGEATPGESGTPTQETTPTLEETPTPEGTPSPEATVVPSLSPTADATADPTETPAGTDEPVSVTSEAGGGVGSLALQVPGTPTPTPTPTDVPPPPATRAPEPTAPPTDEVVVQREAVTDDLVAAVEHLPAGDSLTLTYKVQADQLSDLEAQVITDVLQLSARDMAQPLVAEVRLIVVDPALTWTAAQGAEPSDNHLTTQRIDLSVPSSAYSGDDGILVVRPGAETALPARETGIAAEFDLALLADPGLDRPPLIDAAEEKLAEADAKLPPRSEDSPLPNPERPDAALSSALDERRALVERPATFDEPFELTVSFDGLADLDALWADRQPFVAVWDPGAEVWVRQPLADVDSAANTVTVEATHFSTWGTGIGGTFPENGASTPLFDEAKVTTFTGRATFSYALWIPAGRAGMTPNLALSYASGSIDGVLGDVQSSWVGMGWNIDQAEITRLILNGDCGGNCGTGVYGYADRYVLAFNGVSYQLIEDPQQPGRYHTEEESFLYIQRHNIQLGNEEDGGVAPPNDADEWWEVVTADGTRYRLGWNADSEQLAPMKGYSIADPETNPVFPGGPNGTWDKNMQDPTVLDNGDDTFQMWYVGKSTQIGTAGGTGIATWRRIAAFDPDLLEAEDGTLTAPMIKAGHENASSCEFVWTPEDNGNNNDLGSVDIDFELAAEATTYVWGHVWSGKLYWSIDGGTETSWHLDPFSHFNWQQVDVGSLSAGSHTLRLRTKNEGTPVDAVMVTQDEAFSPNDIYCNSTPVLDPGPNGTWDDNQVQEPDVVLVGGTYHMWYAGQDGTDTVIGHATSTDGIHWTKDSSNPVLTLGGSTEWDEDGIDAPSVVYLNGTYHMWYNGRGGGSSSWNIGHATSTDGVNWTKDSANPVFSASGSGFDKKSVLSPDVVYHDGTYYLYYSGYNDATTRNRLGVATSTDGVNWTRHGEILSSGDWSRNNAHAPAAIYDGTTTHLWYTDNQDIGYGSNSGDPTDPADWSVLPDGTSSAWIDLGYAGAASNVVAQRWRVDEVADTHGNTLTYTYAEETETVVGETETYDRASYLDKMRYTGTGGDACDPAAAEDGACYEVRFVLADRAADFDVPAEEDREDWDTWDEKYLDKVAVYALNDTTETLLRTYDLSISEVEREDSDGDEETWDSLILDDIVVTAGSETAPKIRFDYQNFDNRAQVLGEPEWGYPRLTAIHNGTDGTTTFTYGEDGRPAEQYFAWRVLWQKTTDGVTTDETRTDYLYGPACYQDAESGWCNPDDEGDLVGHEWTQASVKDFDNSTLTRVKHFFYTDEDRAGREWKSETRGTSSFIFFKSETDFTTVDWTTNSNYPIGVRFIYADETRQYERQGTSLQLVTKSTYEYDDDWGDLLEQAHYDGGGTLLRRTAYTYTRNVALPDTFLAGFPRSQITYDNASAVLAATYYAYDGTADSIGTVGELTLQQTRTLADATETIDVTTDYDTYGNVTEVRAHSQHGTLGTAPTNHADDRVSTTTYDATYRTYPITQKNPLNHTVTTTYDFELSEDPLGLPRKVTDPNSAVTEMIYDDLGRVTETWQPGASQANVKTVYPSLNASGEIDAPYTIELQIWDDGGPGGDQYRKAWAFYDGLGRTLRTVGPAEDTNQYIQTDTYFNAFGLVEKSARPYEVTLTTPPGTWAAPNWAALDVTQTDYDAFGRMVEITAPDGTSVQSAYDGRDTTVTDPNGHQRKSTVDDFDRLVTVREYSGDGTGGNPYTLYATTTYAYDARDLLTSTTDDADNVTSMHYDDLGRKDWMDDPDMGLWTYTYDIWGQLAEQHDPRGAQVKLAYDKLGRLTQRQARMDSLDPWDTVASYTYDDTTGGNKGVGRQTGASSVYVSGSPTVTDAVVYDQLGRPTSTTRTIDATAYTTTATYDSLGRVLTTTVPTGPSTTETITTTYNARGMAESLAGTDTYVSDLDYTPTGDVDTQTLGNGVVADFTYDADSNRLTRILTAKTGFLPLVDLTYTYDDAGNVATIDDAVRDEDRSYRYDHLDRLRFADVYAATGMIEERYYTYDELGNLLSFRHRLPSSGEGRGAFTPGADDLSSANYGTRADFNGLSEIGLSSATYATDAVLPYVAGFAEGGPAGYNTRGALYAGDQLSSSSYQGASGFNPLGGSGEAISYDGMGITAFVRGIEGGFGGWGGGDYDGPTGETTTTYTYAENNAGPHAVTSLSDGQSFVYDANGNMTERWQDTTKEWSHTFDAQNRLVTVTDHATTTTTDYVYDGDGGRVKRIVDDGTTTIYVAGTEIELVDSVEDHRTIYYEMGGAFRVIGGTDAGLYFRHSDHLGSTSVLSNSTGIKVTNSEVVYAPFGEIREGQQSELTDLGFTGQRLDGSTGGLMFYQSRYYLPELKRFISADTIVPEPANPQNFNRYAYVLNNPLRFTDPTGHCNEDTEAEQTYCLVQEWFKKHHGDDEEDDGDTELSPEEIAKIVADVFGISTEDLDDANEASKDQVAKEIIIEAVERFGPQDVVDLINQHIVGPSVSLAAQATGIERETLWSLLNYEQRINNIAIAAQIIYHPDAPLPAKGLAAYYIHTEVAAHLSFAAGFYLATYGAGSRLDKVDDGPPTPMGPQEASKTIPWGNPSQQPAPGFEWRGPEGSQPGDPLGGWYNPETTETLSPDESHADHGLHWDYVIQGRKQWRIYPDGTIEEK